MSPSDNNLINQVTLKSMQKQIVKLEEQLHELKKKLKEEIDALDNGIDEAAMETEKENRLRDEKIKDIYNDLAFLESFINEKLAPGELEKFRRHILRNNSGFSDDAYPESVASDDSSIASDDSFEGGRRKRRKKTRKKIRKKYRKYKRRTRRGGNKKAKKYWGKPITKRWKKNPLSFIFPRTNWWYQTAKLGIPL